MTMSRGGATPPQITTVDDLLKKLREGVNETYEIRCRGLVVPIRVLTLNEMNLVRRSAIAEVAKIQGDATDRSVEQQKATLKLASNVNNTVPFLNDKLLDAMSTDEINFLYDEYVTVVDAVNPSMETLPAGEFKEIVDALKKNIITAKDCSLRQLRAICTAYVDLIQRPEPPSSPRVN